MIANHPNPTEITDYERGKRLIQSHALVQFDKAARDGRMVALWAIRGYVWVECDTPGNYRLQQTSVSVYDYISNSQRSAA